MRHGSSLDAMLGPLCLIALLVFSSTLVSTSTAAAAPVATTLYLRSSTNAAGGTKVLNQTAGPTNCNMMGSKCITEAFACYNPFMVPCTSGAPKDFVSPALAGPITISRVAYNIYLTNNNPLITLSFKLMFNLTKNGATIYTQTSDLLSLGTGKSAAFGVAAPGNQLLQNVNFAMGDKIDCSVTVVSVQDSSGKPRAATDLALLYNGKAGSGADSACTITSNVCPAFMADPVGSADQIESTCSLPVTGVPEFGSSAVVVAAVACVLVVIARTLFLRNQSAKVQQETL